MDISSLNPIIQSHSHVILLQLNVDASFPCSIPAVGCISSAARPTNDIKALAVTSASGTTAVDHKRSEKPESPSVYCN